MDATDILWWIGNLALVLVVLPAVVTLGAKILKQLVEVRRYAADIAAHGELLAANVEPAPGLGETRRLVAALRDTGDRYADALQPSLHDASG